MNVLPEYTIALVSFILEQVIACATPNCFTPPRTVTIVGGYKPPIIHNSVIVKFDNPNPVKITALQALM